jgi:hypothetical protein
MRFSDLNKSMICYEPSEFEYFCIHEEEDYLRRIKKNLVNVYKNLIKNPQQIISVKLFLGVLFFSLPFLFFWYKAYNFKNNLEELTLDSILSNSSITLKLNTSVLWIIVSFIFLLLYVIIIFAWKVFDLLQNPNLKHWNIYHIGYSIQYIIFFSLALNFFTKLYSTFSLVDFIFEEISRKTKFNLNNIINFQFLNIFQGSDKLILEISENFKSSINPILYYNLIYLTRLILFDSKYFTNYLIININFLFIYITINYVKREFATNLDFTMFYLLLIFISYFSIIIQEILKIHRIKEITIHNPKYYFKNILLIFQLLRLMGTYLLMHICLIYFFNDTLNLADIKKTFILLITAFLFLIISYTLFFGEFLFNFIFYSIHKEYLIYKNEKYEHFIKRVYI